MCGQSVEFLNFKIWWPINKALEFKMITTLITLTIAIACETIMKVSDDSTEERKECILLALQLIMKFRKGPSLFQTAIQDIAVIVFVTMTT